MTPQELYTQAYRLLGTLTPLPADCGKLCGSACCGDGGQQDAGMYLFPHEQVMLADTDMRIEPSEFRYGANNKAALIAICDGTCDRRKRPLACRIFPLVPYMKKGQPTQVIMDPRGRSMCPLARACMPNELDERFVETTAYLFRVLAKNSEIAEFVEALSLFVDEYDVL